MDVITEVDDARNCSVTGGVDENINAVFMWVANGIAHYQNELDTPITHLHGETSHSVYLETLPH